MVTLQWTISIILQKIFNILNVLSPHRETKRLDNSNILRMFNNNTYTDFRAAYKHILIRSYVIQVI